MKFKTILLAILFLGGLLFVAMNLAGFPGTDIVARDAVKSFNEVATALGSVRTGEGDSLVLESPSRRERFFIGKNVGVELDAAPFIKAGLDRLNLPSGYSLSIHGDNLVISIENKGFEKSATISAAFERFVANNRDSLGYHASLDHFGIALKVSHFEWAKTMLTNENDMVFMLNPVVLSQVGVDVAHIDGWQMTNLEVMVDGKTVRADRLLKTYNLRQ